MSSSSGNTAAAAAAAAVAASSSGHDGGHGKKLIVGLHLPQSSHDVSQLLSAAREDGFDFVTTSLSVSSTNNGGGVGIDGGGEAPPPPPLPRVDVTTLSSGRWWRNSVVGVIVGNGSGTNSSSSDIDQPQQRQQLSQQIEWCIHMGIPAIIFPPPPTTTTTSSSSSSAISQITEYARVVHSFAIMAHRSSNMQVWIRITNLTAEQLDTYELVVRLCDGLPTIGMLLVFDQSLSLVNSNNNTLTTTNATTATRTTTTTLANQLVLLHRAVGIGIKTVAFPTKIFLTNKRGYPTLSKSHQCLFHEVLKRIGRTVRCIVEGPSIHHNHTTTTTRIDKPGSTQCLPYLQYLRHLRGRDDDIVSILDSEEATMETPYLDSLQKPLEPLKDNLEFSMYETFEKDPIKYRNYQLAVYLALQTGITSMNLSPTKPKQIIIAVAGAGRGPLVLRSIRAFQQIMSKGNVPPNSLVLKVYAVEKNEPAVVFLQSMAHYNPEWKGIVTVVQSDARTLRKADLNGNRIDIVVSELLGSFGDNELSPECLDPLLASDCCKTTTISIPMRYSSYLAPVCSNRLHAEAVQQAVLPDEGGQSFGIQRAMETAYVVRTHAASQTHPEQHCWEFTHPKTSESHERTATLQFGPNPTLGCAYGCGYGPIDRTMLEQTRDVAGTGGSSGYTIHGLVGSFTAVLYENDKKERSTISIAPHEFSNGMFSWFPIYFPFRDPLRVPADATIDVKMWRRTSSPSKGRVWFEWCATIHRNGEILESTPIHNINGRSSFVSL